jgi:uroporphyrinogen III methyltransferase/synthase
VECVPPKYDTENLGKALAEKVKPGERVLIPRAEIGSRILTEWLDDADIVYDDIPVYKTVFKNSGILNLKELFESKRVDFVAFTSASTVKGFAAAAAGTDFTKITAVCIGKQTAEEAGKFGMTTVISDQVTVEGLAAKIIELHQLNKKVKRV